MIPIRRALLLSASLLFALPHYTHAQTPNEKVIVHVQILKDGRIVEDVTTDTKQGDTVNKCYGTKLDQPVTVQGLRRIDCDGLRISFLPVNLSPQAIQASFTIEYYKPAAQTAPNTTRLDGFSLAATPNMTPGTPIVASQPPYSLRIYAKY